MVQVKVEPIPAKETYPWLKKKHYAHRIPNIMYSYGLFTDNVLTGVCTFGMPPTDKFSTLETPFPIIELNRLVINEGMPKNTLSQFVSRCLKALPRPMIVVSYASPSDGHTGYIYQATNWIYTGCGRTDEKDKRGTSRYFYKGKEHHDRHIRETAISLHFTMNPDMTLNENWVANGGEIIKQERKHRYFQLIGRGIAERKKMLALLKSLYMIKPYPKGVNTRYDASFKPTAQTTLDRC